MNNLFTIKPLEFERHKTKEWHLAITPIGPIEVRFLGGAWHWAAPRMDYVQCDSFEAGKLAAEAHYRERLMQALEPVEEK